MPVTISKPALRDLYNKVVADANAKVDTKVLDQIVSIVGDKASVLGFGGKSSEDIAKQLSTGSHSPEQKLAIAQAGLDKNEKADLRALLEDPAFAAKLDATAANFLKAVVGLEPLKNVDRMESTSTPKVTADPNNPQVQAANKLKELIKSGDLRKYYDAAIGAVDNPQLKAEALELFSKLPTIKPGMKADDFVKAGLWTVAPRGIEEMQKSARYLPGRQLIVETKVHASVPAPYTPTYETERRKVGTYDEKGVTALTHRATLIGDDPNNPKNFLVKVDGTDKPISVSKETTFKHNQPHDLSKSFIQSETKRELPWHGQWGTWKIDYESPLAKAKLCEIALKMDDFVAKLDFTKTKTTSDGRLTVITRGGVGEKMVEMQKKCVETVFRSIDMKYPNHDGRPFTDPGRAPDGERDAARQAIRGTGMCVQQSVVFGALLTPFMEVLGVDGQYRSGNCFRNIKSATENVFAPDNESGHGWWQITFRPSMEMTVTDRTWDQVNLTLDRAYGFPYGDRYANSNLTGWLPRAVGPTDINVSGDVSVETVDRQFSQKGDGRENHISNRNDG